MKTHYLQNIHTPADVKKLDYRQLEQLSQEIRAFLIEHVSQTGGHLSSNLGVVELMVSLHHCFDSPTDSFVFDVGHQCYTHKILTGRREEFDRLRQSEGLSGFPCPNESAHDIFVVGHGSTSLASAIGYARAKKLRGQPGYVLAIIGDGAFTGGMTYEGLNNIGELDNLIVILNDNKMSISKNVGALAQYFTKLRTSTKYYKAKNEVKLALTKTPVIGGEVTKGIQSVKSALRRSIYQSTFFEEMGLQYIGPIDGHDIPTLCNVFGNIDEVKKPVFVHVATIKGKGFSPAEENPGAFHGVSAFNSSKIADPDLLPKDSFSNTFGRALAKISVDDENICAITAAMKYATGLHYFKKTNPERFFDVGMAEEFAVTYGAGLAAGGFTAVVAIYSTFLQRGYDQIIHDVMLQKHNVLFAIDRAGLVPGDGETHQGIYDAAFLSQQNEMPIVSPSNYAELEHWLQTLLTQYTAPRAIRYPRGRQEDLLAQYGCSGNLFDKIIDNDADHAIVTYGAETVEATRAAGILEGKLPVDVYKLVWINPLPEELVQKLLSYKGILFAEEGIESGGVGEHLATALFRAGYKGAYNHSGIRNIQIDHAGVDALRKQAGLDAESLACKMQEMRDEA